MKDISTLIKDIHGLFGSQNVIDAASAQGFSERLSSCLAERVVRGPSPPSLRLSNLGIEPRKLWYSINRPELAEPLPPEVKIKFLYGDVLEEMLLWLAKEAGHTVEREQEEVTLYGITGHIDAIIDGVLVDVKSASSFSYNKFADGSIFQDDPFGYRLQIDAYGTAVGGPSRSIPAAWLVMDKTLGKLQLVYCPDQKVDYEKYIADTRLMLSKPIPPPRSYTDEPDGKSGNRKLPIPCAYCSFHDECWPGLRTFIYSRGPSYLTRVARLPEVLEVTKRVKKQPLHPIQAITDE